MGSASRPQCSSTQTGFEFENTEPGPRGRYPQRIPTYGSLGGPSFQRPPKVCRAGVRGCAVPPGSPWFPLILADGASPGSPVSKLRSLRLLPCSRNRPARLERVQGSRRTCCTCCTCCRASGLAPSAGMDGLVREINLSAPVSSLAPRGLHLPIPGSVVRFKWEAPVCGAC